MTSYTLSDNTKQNLRDEAKRLLELQVDAVQVNFPLTHAQVVKAVTPPEAFECFRVLKKLQADSLVRTSSVCGIVHASQIVLIEMSLIQSIYYVWQEQTLGYRVKRDLAAGRTVNPHIPFDLDTLDHDTQMRLRTWVDIAARQRRIADNSYLLIDYFLKHFCNSTGELYRRWPGLRVLFTQMADPWPERMRDVRGLRAGPSRWNWSGPGMDWYLENQLKIQGVEAVLVGCQGFDTGDRRPQAQTVPVSARVLAVAT